MYDFEANDPEEMRQKTHDLEGLLSKLSRTVNARAMHHLDQQEEQHTDLLKKKKILEGDRKKILESIKKLDEKKKATLLEAWEKVSFRRIKTDVLKSNFGLQIFVFVNFSYIFS